MRTVLELPIGTILVEKGLSKEYRFRYILVVGRARTGNMGIDVQDVIDYEFRNGLRCRHNAYWFSESDPDNFVILLPDGTAYQEES